MVTSVYLALMMTVFLFYTGTLGFQGIAEAKYSAFLTLCGGYVACMLLLLVETVLVGGGKFPSPRTLLAESSWVQRLLTVYLVVTWISTVLSPHFPVTVLGATRDEGALTITIYVLSFLLVSVFGRIEKWMLSLFAATVSFFDLICILQLFGLNPFTLYPEGYNYFGADVDYYGAYLGTIGNVGLVAAFLCLAIPIFWVTFLRSREWRRWLLMIPLGLSLFVLLKMWVLAGLVGVFAGGAVVLCSVAPVPVRTRKTLWLLLASTAVAALALLFCFDVGDGLFHEMHLLLHGKISDDFGSSRFYIWRMVLERIPQQFWLGSGPDTMHLAGLEPFQGYDDALKMSIIVELDIAHNEFLNILFHQGVLALSAYLSALVIAAKRWLKVAYGNAETAILGSALFCYCVQSFFSYSQCIVAPYFWLIFALLEAINKRRVCE